MRRRRRARPRASATRRRERGVALLLVLWVFVTLGILALDFGRYMRDDAMAAVNFAEETEGYYIALAGMNKTLFEAIQDRDQNPTAGVDPDTVPGQEKDPDAPEVPVDGEWHDGTFHGKGYRVRLTDVRAKISLNWAAGCTGTDIPGDVLSKLLANLMTDGNATRGVDRRAQKDIDALAGAIGDWCDLDDLKRLEGAESEYYEQAKGHPAKNYKFEDPAELLMVRGVTSDLYYGNEERPGLRDIFQTFSDSANVNIRAAGAPVLQILLRVTREEAEELIQLRKDDYEAFRIAIAGRADPALADVLPDLEEIEEADVVRVYAEAQADTQAQRNRSYVAAVVDLRHDEFEGPRVLRWFDRAPFAGALPTGEFDREPVS